VDITRIPIPPISLLLVVLRPLQEEFHFQGNSHTNDMLIPSTPLNSSKSTFPVKFFSKNYFSEIAHLKFMRNNIENEVVEKIIFGQKSHFTL
jgi:hypothetical protein